MTYGTSDPEMGEEFKNDGILLAGTSIQEALMEETQ
jgi:hypothetical protein